MLMCIFITAFDSFFLLLWCSVTIWELWSLFFFQRKKKSTNQDKKLTLREAIALNKAMVWMCVFLATYMMLLDAHLFQCQ